MRLITLILLVLQVGIADVHLTLSDYNEIASTVRCKLYIWWFCTDSEIDISEVRWILV